MSRIMVDMSATLLHHGHIRILRFAKQRGTVVVALTTDDEILSKKGYHPELDFEFRKEVMESIRYVDEVVPSPWFIDLSFLNRHQIDFLVHGDDNRNDIPPEKVLIVPRTPNVSSSDLRSRAVIALAQSKNS